ncbi:hypothetical protein KY336_04825 [Candidatus Woesearchaeota archaeon]|nr:hypothetical protein [Candidatus Woesearchaeota archaeon]
MKNLLKSLEERVLKDTHSADLEEQRNPRYCVRKIKDKIVQTLRDKTLRKPYLRGLNSALTSLYKPIEFGKRKLKERELKKTHYFVNMHYHSSYPFSLDAVRLRDPFVSVIKNMRKHNIKILYVTDHDNNLFFWTLRNNPPRWVTKNYDIHSDDWMITLSPKKRKFRRKPQTMYIMNAQEYHIRLDPDDNLKLNLEVIAPTNARPGRASFPPLTDLLHASKDTFVTLNHPNHFDSFETEKDMENALGKARDAGTVLFVERFNGGVTPVQGYVNLFAEDFCQRHPEVPTSVGSDLHVPIEPAGVWIKKNLLRSALDSKDGLKVNQAIRNALLMRLPGNVVNREIYSSPSKVFASYVGKSLTG